ncbi:phage head-tail joining protein, partial [Paenirhodobacter ferrireducens]
MSFTQEQLDALRAARATGALEVSQGNERVRYRSLAEL